MDLNSYSNEQPHRMLIQQGQVLVEFVVVVALLILVSVYAAAQWQGRVQQLRIDAMASWLLDLREALLAQRSMRRASELDQPDGDVALLVPMLKRQGYLPQGFAAQAPMAYQVGLQSITGHECGEQNCAHDRLIVAVPDGQRDFDLAMKDGFDLLLALRGQGAMVPMHQAGRVEGVGLQYDRVQWRGGLLPQASVVLGVSSHASESLSFVRLNENRPVSLSGYVTLSSTVRFMQVPHMDEGLVMGKSVTIGENCRTYHQVALLHNGGLGICESQRWQPLVTPRQLKPCQAVRYDQKGPYEQGLVLMSGLGSMSRAIAMSCDCSAGFVPRFLGQAITSFQGVSVEGGFLCESL